MSYDWHGQCKNLPGKVSLQHFRGCPEDKGLEERSNEK